MIYVLIGALIFLLFRGASARRALARLSGMKLAAAVFAAMAFAGAGFIALRGGWVEALVRAALGALLTTGARWSRQAPPKVDVTAHGMSAVEARATLGVTADASTEEIKAAYARLIQRVHPDRGGAAGLAAHLNLARDVLLKS